MILVDKPITRLELLQIAKANFGNLVKAVVDLDKQIMAIDAPMHSDEEAYLLSLGSTQSNLWGINLYPEIQGDDFIEFDSMINLRPNQGNLSRGIDDQKIQEKIQKIINSLII